MGRTLDLPDGYIDLPAGKVANVATYLQMFAPPSPRLDPPGVAATMRYVVSPDVEWYRALFHKVGDDWLWSSRIAMDRAELKAILEDPLEEVYAIEQDGVDEGLLELDFRTQGQCELIFFGLSGKLVGTGAGRWAMNRAIARAWSKPIARFWVHTCSIDHPNALDFYRRSGFVPYERKIEIMDDPRLVGLVPRDAAPQIPLISSA
jgi:GNAT superfamily N-acetyltransferase